MGVLNWLILLVGFCVCVFVCVCVCVGGGFWQFVIQLLIQN